METYQVDVVYLIDMFAKSLGVETAEKIVYNCIDSADLPRKKYYSEEEFSLICDKLKLKGGFIRTIVEVVEKGIKDRDIYYRYLLMKERREKEELKEIKTRLENTLQKMQEMQQNLIKSEKLAAIGNLAAAVAHELRNPLSALTNISYYLSQVLKTDDSKINNMVKMLSTLAQRMTNIVNDLLTFSIKKKINKIFTDVDEVVNKTLNEIDIPGNIKLIRDIEQVKGEIDPDRLRQILFNLISNAKDAIKNSGEIYVKLRKQDDTIELTISDTGCGMDEEVQKHIFEPLFTTKPKGLGLGMAIVKELVELHQGKIEVNSKPSIGTTFKITLPIGQGGL